MAFDYNNPRVVVCPVTDFAADGTAIIWRAPVENTAGVTIKNAVVVADTALNAGTANGREIRLLNGGTAGTSANAITPYVGTATSGTYAAWVAQTPKSFTLGTATLASGEYLAVEYNETGTDSWKNLNIIFEFDPGT